MPAMSTDLQKRFQLTIVDGLPEAALVTTGASHWVRCCPLCGCIHQVIGADETLPYTPMCQTVPLLYHAQQVIWRKLYTDVANYTTLRLVREASD